MPVRSDEPKLTSEPTKPGALPPAPEPEVAAEEEKPKKKKRTLKRSPRWLRILQWLFGTAVLGMVFGMAGFALIR